MPIKPSLPSSATASAGNRASRSRSAANGASRVRAKSRATSRSMRCSSVSLMTRCAAARSPRSRSSSGDRQGRRSRPSRPGGSRRRPRPAPARSPANPRRWARNMHPHDIGEAGARLGQRRLDVAKRLPGLLGRVLDDRHPRIVEPGRAGDKDPLAVDHRPAIPGLASNGEPERSAGACHRRLRIASRRRPGPSQSLGTGLRTARSESDGLASGSAAFHAVSVKISRPISMRRISEVPAPIS